MDTVILTKTKPTQVEIVLEHLVKYGTITPLVAWNQYHIMRLGARIWDLKQMGYLITPKSISVGDGIIVAEYTLIKSDKNGQISFL